MKLTAHQWCATAVFTASLIVYGLTMADTVSFWDCGEFSACSYTMSVPHPPGSPLFLLIGRVFSILPFSSDIAVRVTWISVLCSAVAILLTYLTIVLLVRHIRGPEKTDLDRWIAYGGGIIGALTLSWSYSMWFNAVESEVYAMSQLFTHLVVWLILVWNEKADEPGNERWLILIAYTIGLSTGVHLLMVLAIPALALVIYFRRKTFEWSTFIGMMAATGLAFILVYPGVVKWLPTIASKFNLLAPFIVAAAIGGIFWWAIRNGHGIIGVGTASILLIIIGYSAYNMIYIRSNLNPPIDENDPDNPARFLSYLNREQYGDRDMFPRMWNNDPAYRSESDFFWRYQVNEMFNRYLFWQYVGRDGAPEREYQDAGVEPNYSILSLIANNPSGIVRWLAIMTCLPLLLGLIGFFHLFAKDKPMWLVVSLLFFMTGYAVILYLNQDKPQPRERDYSYTGAFYAFALWIGIGAAAVIEWVGKRYESGTLFKPMVAGITGLMILLSPVMVLAKNYTMNDRSGNYVAWDYSYNTLMSCDQNGILFTNGDNDTFPVWYLQEVEGIRKDVRLVNLSLLNTGWYIKQLKTREPIVPISFTEAYVDRYLDQHDATAILARHWPPEKQKVELSTPQGKMSWTMPASVYIPYKSGEGRDPNFLRVQDIMILDLLRTNFDPTKTPNPRPIYFGVTVANSNMIGLRDYLSMEGLLFKVNPSGHEQMNPARMEDLILNTYRGHFRGINDPGVHFDDNVSKLLQNYRSAFLQLAYYYRNRPDEPGFQGYTAESLDDRLDNFSHLTNRDKARTLMQEMERQIPESVRSISSVDLSLQLGRMFYDLGEQDELRKRLEWAEARNDLNKESMMRVAATWQSTFGDTTRANRALAAALGDNPTAEDYYQAGTQMFAGGSSRHAASYLEKALELDPSHGQAIGALMQTYENLGEYDKAEAVLEGWVISHPRDTGAKRRLDQLKSRSAQADSARATQN